MVFNPDFFNIDSKDEQVNQLLKYLQEQKPEILEQVAKSASPQIRQIISQNVRGMVGLLPTDNFNVQIATSRENIANLLASAMMTGYFLRQMEQRMQLDDNLANTTSLGKNSLEDEE